MKVLLINGSTRKNGTTFRALSEVAATLNERGVETEIVQMGPAAVHDCRGCNYCQKEGAGTCVFADDMVNEWLGKAAESDGFVFGSPVYYAQPTGQLLAVLHRMFYAGVRRFASKPGAAVVTARRAGTTASLDALNKFFANAGMPQVPSTYWNQAFGPAPENLEQDAEGLQTMRNLGRNMAWLLKCIEAGKQAGIEPPAAERDAWTCFTS